MSYNQMKQQPVYYIPQPQQPLYQMPVAPQGLKGRPVSSIEEARAITIDFDGTVFYFPDLANQTIYTKQLNMDGTVSLQMYKLTEIPQSSPTPQDFITRKEFEVFLSQLNNKKPDSPIEFKF